MVSRSSLVLSVLTLLLPLGAGCGGASSDETVAAVTFDPCQPFVVVDDPAATADEQAGARAAATSWAEAAGARGSVIVGDAPAGALPVHFQPAAAPSHGFFDPARGEIFVNEDLSGRPLAVTIAHELGHAFGLVHVVGRASVMNAGNLDVEPNADDAADLARLWGTCAAGASAPH